MRANLVRFVTPFALAALAACASGGRGSSRGGSGQRVYVDSEVVQLRVQSSYVGPLDLYLVSDGVASRLGEASGPTAQTFVIDPSQFDIHDLRVVAVPVGGFGRASTGLLTVRRGNVVQFNIAPELRQSSVFVR